MGAAAVVVASWITMVLVLLRIEPDFRVAAKKLYARRRG